MPLNGTLVTQAWEEENTSQLQSQVLHLAITVDAKALADNWIVSSDASTEKAAARPIFLSSSLSSLGITLSAADRSEAQE